MTETDDMQGRVTMLRTSLRTLAGAFAFWMAVAAGQSANAADVVRVGEGPFITGGGFYVANERGYFKKMDLDMQVKKFNDGALAVPAILAGDLDITLMTANASFFNSVAKGAPLVIVLDRGHNRLSPAITVPLISCPKVSGGFVTVGTPS